MVDYITQLGTLEPVQEYVNIRSAAASAATKVRTLRRPEIIIAKVVDWNDQWYGFIEQDEPIRFAHKDFIKFTPDSVIEPATPDTPGQQPEELETGPIKIYLSFDTEDELLHFKSLMERVLSAIQGREYEIYDTYHRELLDAMNQNTAGGVHALIPPANAQGGDSFGE